MCHGGVLGRLAAPIIGVSDFRTMASRTKRRRELTAPPGRARSRQETPVLAFVVGGVFLAVLLALAVAYYLTTRPTGPTGAPIDGIGCDNSAKLVQQFHVHLDILYQETPVPVPAEIGVLKSCTYWIHTNDDTGVIDVGFPSAGSGRQYTLGNFFDIWNQPLSNLQVATLQVGKGQSMRVWVNGRRYTGDPAAIVLRSHEQIVIQIGPPFLIPVPSYTWDTTQYPH